MKVNSIKAYNQAVGQTNIRKANSTPQNHPSSTPEFTGSGGKVGLAALAALAGVLGIAGCAAPPVKTPTQPTASELANKLTDVWKQAGIDATGVPNKISYVDHALDYTTDKELASNTADGITYKVSVTDNATSVVLGTNTETYTLDKTSGNVKLTTKNADGTVGAEYLLETKNGYLEYIDPATGENAGNFKKIKQGVVGVFNNDTGAVENELTNYTLDGELAFVDNLKKDLRAAAKGLGSEELHSGFHLPPKADLIVVARDLASSAAKETAKVIV